MGTLLATHLQCPFVDADDLHPKENIDKMSSGIPLTDDDRWGWLKSVARAGSEAAKENGCAVAACSALSEAHRDCLRANATEPVLFVILNISRPELTRRITQRQHHFMKVNLLDSQLAALQVPSAAEGAIVVDETVSVDDILAKVEKRLGRQLNTN